MTPQAVPYECFDIACFHPYRPPSPPEERFDWWELDQYVKNWHKHDLTAEYPLVRMSFLEQTEELVKTMRRFAVRSQLSTEDRQRRLSGFRASGR